MDFETLLFDRIEIIKLSNIKYDLEHKAYISFSGGKDSTILHHLIDIALPNNKIPRVFFNTGLEYNSILKFVKDLKEKDNRFIIINNPKPIKKTLDEKGYPFKSKEFSLRVHYFHKGTKSKNILNYINYDNNKGFKCPKKLLYLFDENAPFKNISNRCCYEFKKDIASQYEKNSGHKIRITGMRNEEGGNRKNLNCFTNNHKHFHPLIKVNEEWENEFIQKYNIKLCELYYPPFNFKRTGCRGCPYNLKLQENLNVLKKYLPNEYKMCLVLWKPVYDEYKRIGYRLKGEL